MHCQQQLSMWALQCLKRPEPIGVGYAAQYIIKPFLGYTIAKVIFDPGRPIAALQSYFSGALHYPRLVQDNTM